MNRDESVKIAIAETKIDHLIDQVDCLRAEVQEFNRRVSILERWRSYLLGAAAVIGAVVSAAFHLLTR